MPTKIIYDYLYNVRIHLIWKTTCEKALAYCKKVGGMYDKVQIESVYNTYGGMTCWLANQDIAIFVIDNNKSLNILAHECFHCVIKILREKGLELSSDNEEAFAYYYGWLFAKLHGLYRNAK